jgi:hypothetical protein
MKSGLWTRNSAISRTPIASSVESGQPLGFSGRKTPSFVVSRASVFRALEEFMRITRFAQRDVPLPVGPKPQ